MDKIDRLIDSLKKSNFKKAAKMEAEIIEEQCKDKWNLQELFGM